MTSQLDRLVSRIKRLEEAQRRANRTPQLRHSSIENGAVNVYDGSGQLTGIIGKQFDGTTGAVTVAGPTPPTPTAATVETANSGVLVTWDGTFVQTSADRIAGRPTVAPQDFKRVEVQVADNVDFTAAKAGGDFISAAGGSVYVPWTAGATVYVRLRTWSLAGKFSAWSNTSDPATAGKIGVGDLGFDINAIGGTTIYFGDTDPSTDPGNELAYGDLWLKELDPGPPPQYETYRWTVVAGVDAWQLVQDQGVTDAIAQAVAAQGAADAAHDLAVAAQATADGKITAFYSDTEPTTGMQTDDLWVRTPGDNQLHRFDGTDWVPIQDAGISAALAAAGTAQATADGKVTIYAQADAPTGLTADDAGDTWIDTDNGNKVSVWGNTATVERTNLAVNSSFEYDPAATLAAGAAPSGWSQSTGGTTGTVTASVVTTGATSGTKAAKITGATLSTLNTSFIGYRQADIPAASGDVFRIAAALSFAVTSGSQRPEFVVEWLDAAGTVLSTLTDTSQATMGTAGSRSPVYTTAAAPANTASMRLTIRRRGTVASGAVNVTNADLTVDAVLVERNRPTGAPTTYFDGSSGGEARFTGTSHLSTSTTWQEGAVGTYDWQPRLLRTGAFQPNSIVAKDVIATGTVSAALLEALMVLANVLVGGDPDGAHARMSALGFQTYGVDPGTGLQYEASRRGTGIGDRDAILDPNGNTVFAVDDTGAITGRTMTLAEMPTMDGRNLQDILNDGPRGIVASSFNASMSISGINGTYGIGEVSWVSEVGRNYRVHFECPHLNSTVAGQRALLALRPTIDGSSPTVSTAPVTSAFFNIPAGSSNDYTPPPLTAHGTWADTNGALVRVLATVQAFSGGGTVGVDAGLGQDYARPFRLWVEDIGPDVPDTYIPNDGSGQLSGGPPPPPPPAPKTTRTVQWDATFSKSYKQDGSQRTDTTDLYQGNGDSFNGRNASMCGFNAADIMATLAGATINDFWVYLYAEHWWNFSGGTAQLGLHGWDNPVVNANGGTGMYWGVVGQYHFGRGEGAWFQLPPSLWAGWADGTYRGLLFNAPDDNVLYYGRFSGATDSTHPIVRITYTK